MEELKGLTKEEVEKRVNEGKDNKPIKNPSKGYLEIIFSNVFTYFNLIFALLAAVLVLVKLYKALTFLPLIIFNLLIGIIQEIRAKKVLDKLNLINSPKCLVIRDNKEEEILIKDLVLDDLVVFKSGNQICADAYVLAGEALVNESLLTGESDEIKKGISDKLMSGSFIVSGKVYAKITAVGENSYINKLTLESKKTNNKESSDIIRGLNRIVKTIGILIIPFAIALFSEAYFLNDSTVVDSVDTTIAAILMMIPEGLFLLASVSLALSAYRLATKNVLTHNMKSIETLARVNVLCVDKTGTITDSNMKVIDYFTLDGSSKDDMFSKMSDFAYAQDTDNITMKAIKEEFNGEVTHKFVSKSAFSSTFKYSSVNFEECSYILGAPDFILKNNKEYIEISNKYAYDGYRVLAFSRVDVMQDGSEIKGNIIPIGLIILDNPIRENATQIFSYFKEQGVEVKVISGDNPIAVSKIAKKACIENADKYIDTSTLTDEELIEAASKYNVFGRVSPHGKLVIIKALKDIGKKVAMTGDGVNDILALKEADCSIAMASGSEATISTSQVVLLDSDFSHMKEIVDEGRKVVNNLETSGALFLSKNVYAILLTLICLVSLNQFPVKTTQVGLINTFTIGFPAFLLSQSPNKDIIKGNFIKNILKYAIPAGVTNAIMVTLMFTIGESFGLNSDEISTAATLVMSVVSTLVLINVSRPFNKYKVWVLVLSIAGLLLNILLAFVVPFMKNYYSFVNLPFNGKIILLVLGLSSSIMYLFITYLIRKYSKKTKILGRIMEE